MGKWKELAEPLDDRDAPTKTKDEELLERLDDAFMSGRFAGNPNLGDNKLYVTFLFKKSFVDATFELHRRVKEIRAARREQ